MNEWLQKLLNQAKEIWQKWSATQKIIIFSVLGVTILAAILLISFTGWPTLVPLLGTPIQDEESFARIVTKLDEEIPGQYEIRSENTILIADEKTAKRIRAILIREDLIPESNPAFWSF